jgi:hypothetical protein
MKEIPGYPGYFATEDGKIISTRTIPTKLLTQRIHKGYYHVFVKTGTGRHTKKKMPVHQLVLMAYRGPKQDHLVCRHLNGNPLDNHIDNLVWGTVAENVQDSIKHGTAAFIRIGEQHPRAKLTEEEVLTIKRLVDSGVSETDLAERFNVTKKHINNIKNGRARSHLGA